MSEISIQELTKIQEDLIHRGTKIAIPDITYCFADIEQFFGNHECIPAMS